MTTVTKTRDRRTYRSDGSLRPSAQRRALRRLGVSRETAELAVPRGELGTETATRAAAARRAIVEERRASEQARALAAAAVCGTTVYHDASVALSVGWDPAIHDVEIDDDPESYPDQQEEHNP